MRALRLIAVGLAITAGALLGGTHDARAAACSANYVSAIGIGNPCTVNNGLTTFTISSTTNMPAGFAVSFATSPGSFTLTFYNIVQNGLLALPGNFTNLNNGGTITYTLSGGLQSSFINQVRLDSTQTNATTSVAKDISPAGLHLLSTQGSVTSGSFGNLDTISVTDTITISADGLLSDFSNQYFSVPEPATLALLGSGLFGLGVLRRRRRG